MLTRWAAPSETEGQIVGRAGNWDERPLAPVSRPSHNLPLGLRGWVSRGSTTEPRQHHIHLYASWYTWENYFSWTHCNQTNKAWRTLSVCCYQMRKFYLVAVTRFRPVRQQHVGRRPNRLISGLGSRLRDKYSQTTNLWPTGLWNLWTAGSRVKKLMQSYTLIVWYMINY